MIVSCPNCSTNFKVPEAALGRTMKCARCGHVWKSAPAEEPGVFFAEPEPEPMASTEPAASSAFDDEIPLESPPSRPRQSSSEPDFDDLPGANDLAMAEIDALGFTGEGNDPEDEDDPFSRMSELMQGRQPESMPDVFSPPKPKKPLPRRKGAFILWVVVVILLLAAAVVGLYFFQDRVIDRWPGTAKYYEQVGLRRDVVGAGLAFRNVIPERSSQDNSEVLVVRGVIANISDRKRDIPSLRLALYTDNTLKNLLQEKIFAPPQGSLESNATVGFKLTVDQPDPNAKSFEVTFIASKEAK